MKPASARTFVWSVAPVAVLLALWEITARWCVDAGFLLPPFSAVMLEFRDLIQDGTLPHHFAKSLTRVLLGFASGSLAGVITGVILGWKEAVNRAFHPIISLLLPIPALGWLPIFMLWFGIGELLPIALIFMCSFFPVLYNTETGIRSVDQDFINAAKTLGASERKILFSVMLPLALPSIFTGFRLESGMAWRVIIAAEMVAIPTGIGALMMKAESLIRVDIVIVCLMVLSIMCFCFERFFIYLEQKMTGRWF